MWKLAACAAMAASLTTCAYAPSYAADSVPHPTPRPTQQEAQLPPNCGKALAVGAALKKRGMAPVNAGFVDKDTLLTVYARPDDKLWAIVIISTNGNACVVESGTTWMSAKPRFPYAAGRSNS